MFGVLKARRSTRKNNALFVKYGGDGMVEPVNCTKWIKYKKILKHDFKLSPQTPIKAGYGILLLIQLGDG